MTITIVVLNTTTDAPGVEYGLAVEGIPALESPEVVSFLDEHGAWDNADTDTYAIVVPEELWSAELNGLPYLEIDAPDDQVAWLVAQAQGEEYDDPKVAAAQRIQAAQQAVLDAEAAFAAAVRDSVQPVGPLSHRAAARALGSQSRDRITRILGRSEDGSAPAAPAPTPTVYLRGAGVGDATWARVVDAMHARGWATVRDRTTAWHLARGGVPVVLADFSAQQDDGLEERTVTVGRVRARWHEDAIPGRVRDLLTTADQARHFGADWLDEPATVTTREMELPLISGGRASRPTRHDPDTLNRLGQPGAWVLDEDALARLVATAL
ncbi:hypothetical protein [Nocardia puris]|uniref:Uncharacterized protein n=1 Tax=Nocardia puris TaxID=208602 RepID=A0A366DAK2_9NOCA|nr:hypothetical protein [Nocardia puris]RBO87046.1 hypothetical protein DFR74_112225 [Nocardia puris]